MNVMIRRSLLCVCLLTGGTATAQNLPPAKPGGFPVVLAGQGTPVFTQPVVADLGTLAGGTANVKELIFGTNQGELHVIHRRASDGNWVEAPGFPVTVGNFIASSPAVGDLTGDGVPEIVVGHGNPGTNGPGGVTAYRNTGGDPLWSRNSFDYANGPDGQPDPVFSTPAIGDVDGDGQNEVAWGGFDFRIHLVRGSDGVYEPGWPLFIRDTIWSSPALHDIDGDGRLDIIIGVDAHNEPGFGTPDGGCLHVLRYDASQICSNPANPETCTAPPEVNGFPQCVDQTIFSSPSIGDIDGDGQPEIVHGTGTFYANRLERVYAWNCDGSAVAGWPVTIQGQVSTSPALGNLDGDSALEVVVTADNTRSSSQYHLYAFNGNGTQVFAPRVVLDFFGANLGAGHPVIADVLGADATPEILVPTNTSVAVYSNTGTLLTDSNANNGPNPVAFYTETSLSGVAVADFENDGQKIEVVAVSAAPFPAATDTKIYVWNPVDRSSTPPWGLFRQDTARRGVAPGTASCAGCSISAVASDFFTLPPCRVIDTRAANGPLGGPSLASGAPREFTVTGTCGIPATAKAISVNVTVTQPSGTGHVRFSPGSCPLSATSTINFSAAQTRANNAILALAPDGSGKVKAESAVIGGGTVQLIVDVNGYFE